MSQSRVPSLAQLFYKELPKWEGVSGRCAHREMRLDPLVVMELSVCTAHGQDTGTGVPALRGKRKASGHVQCNHSHERSGSSELLWKSL